MPLSKKYGIYHKGFDTTSAFEFYESIRHQLPDAKFPDTSIAISDLEEIIDEIDVFAFDAYGVLNIGDNPIPGAAECLEKLRAIGKQVFILTNSASSPPEQNKNKFARLGIDIPEENIISSRMAAQSWIAKQGISRWGVMAKMDAQIEQLATHTIRLNLDPYSYSSVDGFILLAASQWNEEQQKLLDASLIEHPRPIVVANPDVAAPMEGYFSTNPGFIGHRILARGQSPVTFHGKPFPSVFELIETRLGKMQQRSRIAMVGDSLHTDILGGAARGWKTVLVTNHGLFSGHPVSPFLQQSGIVPDYQIPAL
ncbi:MAG: HAD-IIA family hydrolase [Rhizobiaceae bacterium]